MRKMAQENEVVELINEFGTAEQFEHVMTLEYKDQPYLILHPLDEEDEGAVVVFAVTTDEDGNESYDVVEDETLSSEVFSEFLMILESDETEE